MMPEPVTGTYDERADMLADMKTLRELLRLNLEMCGEQCRLDHHGNCQAHYLDGLAEGCRVAKARTALARTAKWEEA